MLKLFVIAVVATIVVWGWALCSISAKDTPECDCDSKKSCERK